MLEKLSIFVVISIVVMFSLYQGEGTAASICSSALEGNIESLDSDQGVRSFLLTDDRYWPGGVVPFELDSLFSKKQISMIKHSMETIMNGSCVCWVPRTNQRDFVRFVRHPQTSLCSSNIGRVGGEQTIYLNDNCFTRVDKGVVVHEMMHALGFLHEHQRMDRDCYVYVAPQLIKSKPADYARFKNTSTDFPYDFKSIMHYGSSVYIKSKIKGIEMGRIDGKLTDLDKMKINHIYCGGQTYCQLYPDLCYLIEDNKKKCIY